MGSSGRSRIRLTRASWSSSTSTTSSPWRATHRWRYRASFASSRSRPKNAFTWAGRGGSVGPCGPPESRSARTATGAEPAPGDSDDPAGADDPQDESDESDGEDRPPRLRVPAIHRVPREEADQAEDRDDRDTADERELGGRVRFQESPQEAVELERA